MGVQLTSRVAFSENLDEPDQKGTNLYLYLL